MIPIVKLKRLKLEISKVLFKKTKGNGVHILLSIAMMVIFETIHCFIRNSEASNYQSI